MRGSGNGLDLVNEAGGSVAASVQYLPATFTPNAFMPTASASLTRAYYLNAGSQVRWLAPDGTGGFAIDIHVSTNQQAGFAVSPDDKRIAVSIFSYGPLGQGDIVPPYIGMRMYVEDVAGGDHHVDIFTSNAVAEFPIGWVGGNLLVAVSFPHCCQGPPSLGNPYLASSYHVVDPGTGRRLATICRSGSEPEGPVEPVGAMCRGATGGPPEYFHWNGDSFPAPAAVPSGGPYLDAMSPDGSHFMIGGEPIRIISGSSDLLLNISGYALGWLDAVHVVVRQASDNSLWLLDPRTSIGIELAGETTYLGTLPAAIS
jgi:hypothetical protein